MKNTGETNILGITQIGVTVTSPGLDAGSKQNIFDHFCKLLVICMMSAGMCGCFSYAFALYADLFAADAFLILVAVVVYITGLFKERVKRIGRLVIALALVILAVIFREHVLLGLKYALGHVFSNYNSYYGLGLAIFEDENYIDIDRILASVFLILPFTLFQVKIMQRDVSLKLSFLSVMLYLLAMFLCGCMPDTLLMLMIIIPFACQIGERCICSYSRKMHVSMDNGTSAGLRGLALLLTGVVLSLAAILGYGLFYDGTENVVGPIRDAVYNSSITDLFERIKGGYSAGGINGGTLSNSNGVKFDSSVHLKVTYSEEQKGVTYLKGYVGAVYTGKKWEELPSSVYKTDSFYALGAEDGEILSLSFNIVSAAKKADSSLFSGAEICTAEVELPNTYVNDAAYICAPYFGLLSEEDGVINDLSYIIRKSGTTTSYFSCYSYGDRNYLTDASKGLQVDIEKLNNYLNTHTDDEITQLLELESRYRTFVYENYLEVSESCSRIYDEFSKYSGSSISNAVMLVQNSLSDNCKYTLRPGATPSGEDMIEYFYYTSKAGYCTHFASAAVEMFRSMGIPARYVQGYIIPACAADTAQSITDSCAHAWAEIYVDGFGWVPVEATPGNGSSGGFTPDINEELNDLPDETKEDEPATRTPETTEVPTTTEIETETINQTMDVTEMVTTGETENTAGVQTEYVDEETSSDGQSGQADVNEEFSRESNETLTAEASENNSMPDNTEKITGIAIIIAVIALVLALVMVALLLNRAGKLRKRFLTMKMKNNRNAVINLFADLRSISGKYALKIDEDVAVSELTKHYTSLEEDEWSDYRNICLKAMFSDDETSDEERKTVTAAYKRIVKEIYGSLKSFDRLRFKYIDGII